MAFMQRKLFQCAVPAIRQYSVQKSVFISQSNDVYTNLALEEWMNQNFDFKNHHVMLCYKNDPCLVIANEGNPWMDTNISAHSDVDDGKEVLLARRQGVGKSIYQDQGSMNFTFFTPSENFNRKHNNGVITRALFRKYGMKITQDQDDLKFYNMKFAESGEMIGAKNAYQQCSLLVNADKNQLAYTLQKIGTKDKQAYLNICDFEPKANSDDILSAIGWEYMRTPADKLKDAGKALANKQRGFQMINPTEKWFPGITEIRSKLSNWTWCYGETPKFTIVRSFPVPAQFLNSVSAHSNELRIKMEVSEGKIRDVTLFIPAGLSTSGFTGEAKVVTSLKGRKFTEQALESIEEIFGSKDEKEKFVTECVKQAMSI